jgi:hypothetical protein
MTNGTAYLGQTVATSGEAGAALVNAVLQRVNANILHPREEFFFREPGRPDPSGANQPRQTNIPPPGRGTSSLGLNRTVPGLIPVLVEMGQQQALDRRIALHVEVLQAVLLETGVLQG